MEWTPIVTLEQAREFFKNDRFAHDNGMEIVFAEPGKSVIELEISDKHRNAVGAIMGGVMLTMSDFACAVASSFGENGSLHVTANANVSFLNASRGKKLTAYASPAKLGRSLTFLEVNIFDDTGKHISKAEFTMYNAG